MFINIYIQLIEKVIVPTMFILLVIESWKAHGEQRVRRSCLDEPIQRL